MDPGFPVRHKAHTRYTRYIFETSLATLELLKLNTQLCRVLLVFLFFFSATRFLKNIVSRKLTCKQNYRILPNKFTTTQSGRVLNTDRL